MSGLLSVPFRKADLRSLLAQMKASALAAEGSIGSSAAVRAAKQWAMMANLIDARGLTAEGQLVATKDPYLEATVTDWIIHFYLSDSDQTLFQYFTYEFSPNHPSFTQDELIESYIQSSSICDSDLPVKNIKLILKLYTDSQAIANSQFLIQSKKCYSTGHSDLSNPYTIGYLLAKCWERDFSTQSAVLVDQILNAPMGLSAILGINREQLRQQLDVLAKYEMIEQRSARLHLAGTQARRKQNTETSYQVVRRWDDPIELLQKAYENDRATPNQPLVRSLDVILDDDDDIPDFSKLLEWIAHLHPRQVCWLLDFGAIVA